MRENNISESMAWIRDVGLNARIDGWDLERVIEEPNRFLLVYLRDNEKVWIEVRPGGHGTSDVTGNYVDFSILRNPPDDTTVQPPESYAALLVSLVSQDTPKPPKTLFAGKLPKTARTPDIKNFNDLSRPPEGRAEISLHSRCGRRCLLCQDHYRQKFSRFHRWKQAAFDLHLSISERLAPNALTRPNFGWIERQASLNTTLLIHGPDATLNPYLEETIQRAKNAGFQRVEVQAPGSGLQDHEHVARLAEAGLDKVFLPLHSFDAATYDGIVQTSGALAVLLKAIENLEKNGVAFQLNLPLMRQNLHDFLETARICEGKGWEYFVGLWFPDKGYGWGYGELSPSFQELRKLDDLCQNNQPFIIGRLPPCGYPQDCREAVAQRPFKEDLEDFGLVHPEPCAQCRWRKQCPGVHPAHLKAFGENDLEPIPD